MTMKTDVNITHIYEYFVCYDVRRNGCEYSCIDSVFAENASAAKTKALDLYKDRMSIPPYRAPFRFRTFAVRRDRAYKSENLCNFVLQKNFANYKFHKRGLYFVDNRGGVRFSENGADFLLRHNIVL